MSTPEDFDARLARLGASTAALRPTPGFRARTLDAVRAEAFFGLRSNLSWGARRLVPVAIACALGAVSWAVSSEQALSTALATSYGTLELEW